MKKTVLAIGAHPDDIEIGCGGTLAILRERGYETVHVIVTSGEEGGLLRSKTDLAALRESEANSSAEILGTSQVIFFREPDGLTSFSKDLKIKMISVLRNLRPEIVFTHASGDLFPDHQVVHQLTRAAVLASRGPWYPDAENLPHVVRDFYGYEVWNPISNPQFSVDISLTMSKKIKALMAHSSQLNDIRYVEAVRGLAKYRGAMTMNGDFAEAFEVLSAKGIE